MKSEGPRGGAQAVRGGARCREGKAWRSCSRPLRQAGNWSGSSPVRRRTSSSRVSSSPSGGCAPAAPVGPSGSREQLTAALEACRAVAAERRRAADQQVADHPLGGRRETAVALLIGVEVAAQDVGHLEAGAGHRLGRQLGVGLQKLVERMVQPLVAVAGDLQVDEGGLQRAVPQQILDVEQVRAVGHQVGREAVAERFDIVLHLLKNALYIGALCLIRLGAAQLAAGVHGLDFGLDRVQSQILPIDDPRRRLDDLGRRQDVLPDQAADDRVVDAERLSRALDREPLLTVATIAESVPRGAFVGTSTGCCNTCAPSTGCRSGWACWSGFATP